MSLRKRPQKRFHVQQCGDLHKLLQLSLDMFLEGQ